MATLQASSASNWPRIDPDAVEVVEAVIEDYDFVGNWEDLTVAVEESVDGEPYLAVYGYATFEASKPITGQNGSVVDRENDCTEEFLKRLALHLKDPLIVETVGFEKCRFPLLASQWAVWPDGTVAHDALDHSPKKLDTTTSEHRNDGNAGGSVDSEESD